MPRFTFKKQERLTSRKAIAKLMASGKPLNSFPFRAIYLLCNGDDRFPLKILISVPKKKFRKATDRNRIKRLIREAWRTQKHLLTDSCIRHNTLFHLALIYTGTNTEANINTFTTKINLILHRLSEINEHYKPPAHPDSKIL